MPVGSTKVVEQVLQRGDIAVVSNPEFLREGSAVNDFLHPDRIVIGANDQAAAIKVASLYIGIAAPLIVTDPASAETIKYAANAYLATKVSFVNAVAAVCEAVGADVNDVVLGMGYDKRIGRDFLKPGPGWGGSSFPKDSGALRPHRRGRRLRLRAAARRHQRERRAVAGWSPRSGGGGRLARRRQRRRVGAHVQGPHRRPARLAVARRDRRHPRRGRDACGPTTRPCARPLPGIEVFDDPYAACEGAAVLAVLTEWDEFRWLDLGKVAAAMAQPADRRRPQPARPRRRRCGSGFTYQGIGR